MIKPLTGIEIKAVKQFKANNQTWLKKMNKLQKEGSRHLGYGNCLYMLRSNKT